MQKGRICTRESNDVGKRVGFAHPVETEIRGGRKGCTHRQGLAQLHNIAKKHRPKCYQGILRCRAGAGGQEKPIGDGKPADPDRPLGKGMSSEEVRLDDPRI